MGFVSVPLTVHYLGAERYGVWLTISSLLVWVALTDFGLAGNALVNVLSEAVGNDDRGVARQYSRIRILGAGRHRLGDWSGRYSCFPSHSVASGFSGVGCDFDPRIASDLRFGIDGVPDQLTVKPDAVDL